MLYEIRVLIQTNEKPCPMIVASRPFSRISFTNTYQLCPPMCREFEQLGPLCLDAIDKDLSIVGNPKRITAGANSIVSSYDVMRNI